MTRAAALIAVAALMLLPLPAAAQLRFTPARAELVRQGAGLETTIDLVNDGAAAVDITSLGVRGGEPPRMPEGVVVAFVEGAASRSLGPGAKATVRIQWTPGPDPRLHELYGHVEATSASSAPAIASVHGERRGSFFRERVLSLVWLLPLVGAAFVLAGHFARSGKPRNLRRIAMGATLAQLAMATFAFTRFAPGVSRLDGNDGLQLVERHVLIASLGVEYGLGVDGLSVTLMLAVSVVALLSCIATSTVDRRYWVALLLGSAGLAGSFLATDAMLLAAFAALALSGLVVAAPRAKVVAHAVLAVVLVGFAGFVAAGAAGDTVLSDGARALRTLSLPELARVDLVASGALAFGQPAAAVVVVLVTLSAFALGALPMVHDVELSRVPAGVRMLVVTGAGTLGTYVFLRFAYGVAPGGLRWAAGTIAALGVLAALAAGVAALREQSLGRFIGFVGAAHLGLAWVGASALTPAGIEATVGMLVSRTIVVAGLYALVGALEARVPAARLDALGGLAGSAPRMAALFLVLVLAAVGAPGTLGFVAQALAVIGAAAVHPGLALAACAAIAVLAVACGRAWVSTFLGELPQALAASIELEPHGGRVPDLRESDYASIAPLALAAVITGVAPRAILDAVSETAIDQAERVSPPGPLQITRSVQGGDRPSGGAVDPSAPWPTPR